MAIKINNQDLQARYINGNSVTKVMLNYQQIRPDVTPPVSTEYIEYRVNTQTVGGRYAITVPTGWYPHTWNFWPNFDQWCPYNWYVSVDNWEPTQLTGTWLQWGRQWINVDSSWTHTVKITPVVEDYGRALAFWWRYVDSRQYLREIVYDGSLKWYMVSATSTGNYYKAHQYYGCTNLSSIPVSETLPITTTTIGDFFRSHQFDGTSSLSTPAIEVMPDTVTSIWNDFRENQYSSSRVTTTAAEVLSSNLLTIWDSFRYWQYGSCSRITSPAAEVLPNSVVSIGTHYRSHQYYYTWITATAVEVLPSSVVSIWTLYREYQYAICSNMTTISWVKETNISINNYRESQFADNQITALTMTMLNDVSTNEYRPFSNVISPNDITVYVPNAYISNYRDSTLEPWVLIPDANFIWY